MNTEELKKYHDLMIAQDLTELEIKDGPFHLRLSRGKPSPVVQTIQAVGPAPAPSSVPVETPPAPEPQAPAHTIAAPLAGMFYRSPSPTSAPFVKEGDKVAFGDVLCIVEAMKVMNEIRADRPCVIKKILVENGKPVSSGQDLFAIEP